MKHVKLYEEFLNEEATTSWSSMMKGVRAGGSGPWTIVAIQDKKVVGQSIDIKIKDLIPAKYEALKKEFPKAKLHIEDGGGVVVWNGPLNEGVSQDAVYIHQIVGCGQDAAQNFIDDNGIDGAKLAAYVKQHRNGKEKYDVRDIIAGTGVGKIKGFRERFIKSVQESEINESKESLWDFVEKVMPKCKNEKEWMAKAKAAGFSLEDAAQVTGDLEQGGDDYIEWTKKVYPGMNESEALNEKKYDLDFNEGDDPETVLVTNMEDDEDLALIDAKGGIKWLAKNLPSNVKKNIEGAAEKHADL